MILKSYLIEKNILDLMKYQAILMYGENNGIKDDIKEELKKGKEDTETIILFNDEIIKNINPIKPITALVSVTSKSFKYLENT